MEGKPVYEICAGQSSMKSIRVDLCKEEDKIKIIDEKKRILLAKAFEKFSKTNSLAPYRKYSKNIFFRKNVDLTELK